MALDVKAISQALLSRGAELGLFDDVQAHEPKSAPQGNRLFLYMFGMSMNPFVEGSSLTGASVRLEFQMRIMKNMLTDPQDAIDLDVLASADALINALAAGFTLGGTVRNVDVLGETGESLRATAGYVSIGGSQGMGGNIMFRCMDVFVPIVINDCWVYGE